MSKWKPIEDKTGMKYRTYVLVYTKFDYGHIGKADGIGWMRNL